MMRASSLSNVLIGLPGDTVEIKNGKVFINGSEEDEEANSHRTGNTDRQLMVRTLCRRDSYFMLGDNREHSKDSRFWKASTFVTYDEIVGKGNRADIIHPSSC